MPVAEGKRRNFHLDDFPLDARDLGWNVVISQSETGDLDLSTLPASLDLQSDELKGWLRLGAFLPITRFSENDAAASFAESLSDLGIKARVVADSEIATPAVRIRSINLSGDEITLGHFNGGESVHSGDALALLVQGRITTVRSEQVEKPKKRESKVVSSADFNSDETVVDIYFRGVGAGFRVRPKGFDFSFLGSEKSLTAAENLPRLIEVLRALRGVDAAPAFDPDVSEFLAKSWPVEVRKDFGPPTTNSMLSAAGQKR